MVWAMGRARNESMGQKSVTVSVKANEERIATRGKVRLPLWIDDGVRRLGIVEW